MIRCGPFPRVVLRPERRAAGDLGFLFGELAGEVGVLLRGLAAPLHCDVGLQAFAFGFGLRAFFQALCLGLTQFCLSASSRSPACLACRVSVAFRLSRSWARCAVAPRVLPGHARRSAGAAWAASRASVSSAICACARRKLLRLLLSFDLQRRVGGLQVGECGLLLRQGLVHLGLALRVDPVDLVVELRPQLRGQFGDRIRNPRAGARQRARARSKRRRCLCALMVVTEPRPSSTDAVHARIGHALRLEHFDRAAHVVEADAGARAMGGSPVTCTCITIYRNNRGCKAVDDPRIRSLILAIITTIERHGQGRAPEAKQLRPRAPENPARPIHRSRRDGPPMP
jgi:hypothetical protein